MGIQIKPHIYSRGDRDTEINLSYVLFPNRDINNLNMGLTPVPIWAKVIHEF